MKTRKSAVHAQLVGSRIRETREAIGITQAELARRLEISPPAVAALESGRKNATIGTLAAVATAMQVGFDVSFPLLPGTPGPVAGEPNEAESVRTAARAN